MATGASAGLPRLVIRPGALGDFVVSWPALDAVLRPGDTLLVSDDNLTLARVRFPDAHCGTLLAHGLQWVGVDRPEERDVVAWMGRFGLVLSWHGARLEGFRHAVRDVPVEFLPALPEGGQQHVVDYYLEQVEWLGFAARGTVPRMALFEPRDGLAVHPFSGSPRKNWPLERFQQVAADVAAAADGGLLVEWLCGPEERLEAAAPPVDRAGLAHRLGAARAYLGNDSGPTHLAAAVGTPVVALWGHTDRRVWCPRGEHVTVLPFDTPPDEVAHAVLHALRLQAD